MLTSTFSTCVHLLSAIVSPNKWAASELEAVVAGQTLAGEAPRYNVWNALVSLGNPTSNVS